MAPHSRSGTGRQPSSPGAWAAGDDTPPCAPIEAPDPPPRSSLTADLLLGLATALFGGGLGVLGAVVQQFSMGSLAMLSVVGPAIEEIMKPIALVFLVERAPQRIRGRLQVVLTALAGGLVFSILENLVYIHIYFQLADPPPGEDAELLRWALCTPMHVLCSTIVGLGLAREWARWRRTGRRVEIERILPWFAAAVIVHGAYNTFWLVQG